MLDINIQAKQFTELADQLDARAALMGARATQLRNMAADLASMATDNSDEISPVTGLVRRFGRRKGEGLKLSPDEVRDARARWKSGRYTYQSLAKRFKVSRSVMAAALNSYGSYADIT